MITIVMRDKNLALTISSPIYQYDNNIDTIKCLLPCKYENICLKDATVLFYFKDDNGNGDFFELTVDVELFNKDYHQFINRINSKISQFVGKITCWLKVSDYENNYSFETGETSFTILPSKAIPKNAQLQQTYFDQWLIKMNQVLNTAIKTQREATNQANIARIEAEKIKQMYETLIKNGGGLNG